MRRQKSKITVQPNLLRLLELERRAMRRAKMISRNAREDLRRLRNDQRGT
jgi:hypothetical protein